MTTYTPPPFTDEYMASLGREVFALLRFAQASNQPAEPVDGDDGPGIVNDHRGLGRKYHVVRLDGTDRQGEKHHGCELFVLDLTHDPAAHVALAAYVAAVLRARPELAADLTAAYLQPTT